MSTYSRPMFQAVVILLVGFFVAFSPERSGEKSSPSFSPLASSYTTAAAGDHAPAGVAYYVAVNEPDASDSNNGLYPTHQGG